MTRSRLTRRGFLGAGAGLLGAGALAWPRRAQALALERKFLFFFASGGWDTTAILDPHFDTDGVDMDPDTSLGVAGNLNFTDGEDRLGARRFFQRWAGKAAIINGIDVHSVGHDSAAQFMLTGTSASSYSDWPTILAANSALEYPLPHVVFSGPSYAGTQAQAVVRAGGGTLLNLIDGSLTGSSDRPTPEIQTPADEMIDQFVYRRSADWAAGQTGLSRVRANALMSNLERAMELEGRRFEAGLDDLGNNMLDQSVKACELFRLGLSRCAMIGIPGGYDTHSGNTPQQAMNQDLFYSDLDELFDYLATTPGHTAEFLSQEVTIIAMSEFGRTPKFNGGNGRDHWPYNSVMVAGAGVHGNQLLGKTDGGLVGVPIDLASGRESTSGAVLGCESIGTALLKIGGLDPAAFLPGVPVLDALVREA
jgi:uncharacterized protein (DUF1501 family)